MIAQIHIDHWDDAATPEGSQRVDGCVFKRPAATMSVPEAESALTMQEVRHLNERKEALKEQHVAYLQGHPELRLLLADMTAAVMLEKPKSVFPFAAEHFAALAGDGVGPPMLVRGAPPLVTKTPRRLSTRTSLTLLN